MNKLSSLLIVFGLILIGLSACIKVDCACENCEDCGCETCYDGIKNQNETGIDCGGYCAPCEGSSDTITIVLQPDSTDGKDAVIHDINLFTSGSGMYMFAAAWTWNGGIPGLMRSLIEFDLSQMNQNVTILDARLSLYGKPTPPDQHSTLYGSNSSLIQRVTSSWNENSVSWANQPATTTQNQLTLLSSFNPDQDYTNMNVKSIVQDMIDNPETSFGFMIRLKTEEFYRMMTFATSDNSDPSIRPKLVIKYIE